MNGTVCPCTNPANQGNTGGTPGVRHLNTFNLRHPNAGSNSSPNRDVNRNMTTLKASLSLLLMTLALSAQAIFMRIEEIPLTRLIKNAEQKLKEEPTSPEIHYLLGRLYSYAYAFGMDDDYSVDIERMPHSFGPFLEVQVKREAERTPLSDERLGYLENSLTHYRKSLNRFKTPSKAYLGYAWMHEQAAGYAKRVGSVNKVTGKPLSSEKWRETALKLYRTIIEDYLASELTLEMRMMNLPEQFVSQEAAENILRLVGKEKVGSFKKGEEAKLLNAIEEFNAMRSAITPIVFQVSRSDLQDLTLTAPGSKTSFDLAGDRSGRFWPWIERNYAFLVWDPAQTGKIESGRQLFGNATFWMLFNNGFDAMGSLDNNADGWLAGEELKGIAIWHDINGNAFSEAGEVLPLENWNVLALRCSFDQQIFDGLLSRRGMLFRDGTARNLIDWIPTSLPAVATP